MKIALTARIADDLDPIEQPSFQFLSANLLKCRYTLIQSSLSTLPSVHSDEGLASGALTYKL